MPETLAENTSNVIPVWGLMEHERVIIFALACILIDQGRASDVSEEPHGVYVCVYDRHGAPYTVGRERNTLHLAGPTGETIACSSSLDTIIEALNSKLQRYS